MCPSLWTDPQEATELWGSEQLKSSLVTDSICWHYWEVMQIQWVGGSEEVVPGDMSFKYVSCSWAFLGSLCLLCAVDWATVAHYMFPYHNAASLCLGQEQGKWPCAETNSQNLLFFMLFFSVTVAKLRNTEFHFCICIYSLYMCGHMVCSHMCAHVHVSEHLQVHLLLATSLVTWNLQRDSLLHFS